MMSPHNAAAGSIEHAFEIRRVDDDSIDSGYADIAQAKGALDEVDRLNPLTYYGVNTWTDEKFLSFNGVSKLNQWELTEGDFLKQLVFNRSLGLPPQYKVEAVGGRLGRFRIADVNGDTLHLLHTGEGALAPTWRNLDNNTYGRVPTKYEVEKALELEQQQRSELGKWRVAETLPGRFAVVPPVRRLSADMLLIESFNEVVRYERFPSSKTIAFYSRSILDGSFTTPEHHPAITKGATFALRNESLYPSLLAGDALINKATDRQHQVMHVINGRVFYTDGIDEFEHSVEEALAMCESPRLAAELAHLLAPASVEPALAERPKGPSSGSDLSL